MTTRFIVTKEHRRFAEFATTVRTNRTIGICYGSAGIGKTLSARRYANWDKAQPLLSPYGSDFPLYHEVAKTRTVFYTPPVIQTPKQLQTQLDTITCRISVCLNNHDEDAHTKPIIKLVELIIIDEAERLTPTSLELLRDQYDRASYGLILIGMPGIEKQFSRYPQLYSRVGFAHQYRALSQDELTFVLQRQWRTHGRNLDPDDYTDTQTVTAIAQVTRGNFRLLERLLIQIERVVKINELTTVTNDVVEAARSTLVIGVT